MNILKVVADIHSTGLDDILWLWDTNTLKFDACLRLNLFHQHFCFVRVERNTCAAGSCSCSSTTTMNIGLSLFWWLKLNDEVDIWDVKTARGNICGHKYTEFALLKALHSNFALVLSNVTVHDLDILLDLVRK